VDSTEQVLGEDHEQRRGFVMLGDIDRWADAPHAVGKVG
jgi:hypothetical protein